MNKIEQLISRYCPNEVEWKMLGEVCDIFTGGEAPSNNIKGNVPNSILKFPIYGNGAEIYGYTDTYKIDKDAVTISSIGANTGTIYFRKAFFTPIIRLKVVIPKHNNLLPRYLFHYLNSITISSKSSSVPNMNASDVKKIPAPIPPLSVQKEIARILDTFTKLTEELTEELTARKKQYDYYRDQLLNFSKKDIEWKPLKEIFDLKNGYTPSKSNQEYWISGTIPWFRMEDIRENGRVLSKSIQYVNTCAIKGGKLFPANSIIIATSATIGEHALITVPFLSNQRFTNLSLKKEYADKFIIKFLFYYGFVLDEWCKNNITVSNFAGVDMVGFKKFKIPILPLEEQERIVAILDKFDTLTTSISEGLPKEIELRKKQYEYYRDMLLTFPKKENV